MAHKTKNPKPFLKSFFLFCKEYKIELIVLVLGLVLIHTIVIVKSMLIHDDIKYPLKWAIGNTQVLMSFSDKDKASQHLKMTQDLYYDFMRIYDQDPTDPRLVAVAHDMGVEEGLAMKHMDLAKKQNTDIKNEVKILCDTLQAQQQKLRFIVLISKPNLQAQIQKELNITDQDLQKAMEW